MAFLKKKNRRRKVKASSKSKIQEIRSPYSHRKSIARSKLPKKSKKKRYSGELKLSYKKNSHLKKWLFLVGGILLTIIVLYTTVFSNFFQLEKWRIYGDDIVQENSKFEDFLSVYKGKNLIFIDSDKIKKNIIKNYPEIETLKIKKIFPNTLVMEYGNYKEVANILNIVGETQKKFIVNKIGLLVEQDYENPNLPYIKIKTEKALKLHNYALSRKTLEYILDAVYDYEEIFGMKIIDATYLKREKEVHLKTERDFDIWLDTNLSVQKQFAKLKNTMPKLNIYTENLEYIDLRISSVNGERVIFKRR
ncbi:FtsQ-type POTRA domain-containing protein [bacterium]|nr:FtsQ-type POTRA domain-containing protein [bacterium]